MASATIGQAFEVLSILANRVQWESLERDSLQEAAIKDPDRLAREFTAFLQNDCRVNNGGLIVRTVPLDPVKFIGQGWSIIPEEQDARSTALTKVDFAAVGFAHCLETGETRITGEEKLRRLKASGVVRYGASVFHSLWLDYQAHKEDSVLENLYRLKGITYLDFFGDVLRRPDGVPYILCFHRSGGEWHWRVDGLAAGWRKRNVSTVSPVAS
jgi:hypothetical protein